MAGFDLAGREMRRKYLILDQETLGVIRTLEPEINNSHLLASSLFLAWIELATDRALFFQQQEMGLSDEQLLEIREGRQRVWIEASRAQLRENLGGTFHIRTILNGFEVLERHQIAAVSGGAERVARRYCWHPEVWQALLRLYRNDALLPYASVPKGGAQMPNPYTSVPKGGAGIDKGPDRGDLAPGAPVPQALGTDVPPIDREEGIEIPKKKEENLLALFSRPGRPETATELLGRHSLSELEAILGWARQDPFWTSKVDSIDRFAKHLLNGKLGEQYQANSHPLARRVREEMS